MILLGIAVAYFITEAVPAETPDAPWFIFIAGAVAICAMVLPGISGAFILLLFGKYEYIFKALKEVSIVDIVALALGCIVGLLSFARVVSWLFKKYHNLTVALLSGFMIGSLNRVWPWKVTVESYLDRHGELKPLVEKNVLPMDYLEATQKDSFFLQAVIFAAAGFLIVLAIDRLAAYLKMNLATKEIAPLLNISIRGVENKRYRLRKKMDLSPEENLTEYMMQI